MSSPRFNCDRCGLCCRSISGIPQLKQYDRGDGVCCHLTDANLCDMYDSRPEVCNVQKMYSRFASEMSLDDYLTMMELSCECLKISYSSNQSNTHSDFCAVLNQIPNESLRKLAAEIGVCNV